MNDERAYRYARVRYGPNVGSSYALKLFSDGQRSKDFDLEAFSWPQIILVATRR